MRVPRSSISLRRWRSRKPIAALAGGTLAVGLIAGGVAAASAAGVTASAPATACDLAGGKIQHVI
jgi:hypothetical protein